LSRAEVNRILYIGVKSADL